MTDIRIVEVSPRDGLQSETQLVGTAVKLALIQGLLSTGLRNIEVAAFVNPKRVPQMADAERLCLQLETQSEVNFSALVPNRQGLQRALRAGIHNVAFFTAASETFCEKNIGCSVTQSLERCQQLKTQLQKQPRSWLRGYISCAFGCPYEGVVNNSKVVELVNQLQAIGCDEIVLADTIGVATPKQCRELLQAMLPGLSGDRLALHLHDTRGQALANVFVALEMGVTNFDASVAGLGGCPFAPGAAGNLATEDLVYMLEGCGLRTGVDLDALIEAGRFISSQLGRENQSRVGVAGGLPYTS